MASRLRPDRKPGYPKPKAKTKTSPDKERQQEDDRHHPMAHPLPRPKHKAQKKPALPPRHTTHPEPLGPNQDPGPFADRPRPGKITKKAIKGQKKR
jgi:hypothetical protein